ncbi:hypothetical protein LX36DRAFT_661779 [Colletotrichum falcatum]|nr:hypothetical protein LX36DRAFT_661779 [Colletotrichum falcatum]
MSACRPSRRGMRADSIRSPGERHSSGQKPLNLGYRQDRCRTNGLKCPAKAERKLARRTSNPLPASRRGKAIE